MFDTIQPMQTLNGSTEIKLVSEERKICLTKLNWKVFHWTEKPPNKASVISVYKFTICTLLF